ncbi:MAG: hypothetical protein V1787_05075 [Candidatus Micrarchaeota archaeon]
MAFRARRGQAFETMMLVISVIVALAILGVLLNILGVVGGGSIGSDPKSVMEDNIRALQSKGFGMSPPKKVTFSEETYIFKKDLTGSLPITDTMIKFMCASASDPVCKTSGTDGPVIIEGGHPNEVLHTKKKIDVLLVTCANEDSGLAWKYCVVIGAPGKESDATTMCKHPTDGCKLTG